MDSLYALKDLLCDEIGDIVEKNDITPTELERAYKAVDIIKDIVTIDAMENSGEYSYNSYDDGMSYARGGNQGGGGGYSGRRDSMGRYSRNSGRYSRNRGYSRADEKEAMLDKIEEMQKKIEQM